MGPRFTSNARLISPAQKVMAFIHFAMQHAVLSMQEVTDNTEPILQEITKLLFLSNYGSVSIFSTQPHKPAVLIHSFKVSRGCASSPDKIRNRIAGRFWRIGPFGGISPHT